MLRRGNKELAREQVSRADPEALVAQAKSSKGRLPSQ